jgi:sulfatase maturation enzyme AslB (radical SAM superfamily)
MRPKNELVYKDWVEVMKDPIFRDVRDLIVSGGEPSLFADYVLAVKLFVDTMPKLERLVINSNGFTPDILIESMAEIAKYCKRKGVKLVASVSIDGVEDVHDSLRRIKNGFNKCAKTVSGYKKLASKYGFKVAVSSLLLKKNIDRYQEMVEWLRKSKTEGSFQVVGFHDTYIKNMESKGELDIDSNVKEKFIEVLEAIRDSKSTRGISRYYWEDMISMYKNGTNRTTPCPFLYDDFVVDSLGDVYYCLSVRPIGNFIKEKRTVGEIYYDPKNIEFRKNLPKKACKKCNSGCNAYRATAYDMKRYAKYKLTGKLGAETS